MSKGLALLLPANAQKKGPHFSEGLIAESTPIRSLRRFQQMADQIADASAFNVCTSLQVLAEAPVERCGYALRLP